MVITMRPCRVEVDICFMTPWMCHPKPWASVQPSFCACQNFSQSGIEGQNQHASFDGCANCSKVFPDCIARLYSAKARFASWATVVASSGVIWIEQLLPLLRTIVP